MARRGRAPALAGLAVVAALASASAGQEGRRAVRPSADPGVPREPEYKPTISGTHPAIRDIAAAGEPVSRLAASLASGAVTLARRPGSLGYLPAVLDALGIQTDSQMLVFSKTSVQAPRISPAHPRAIYFRDEVVVAHVPDAPGLELVAIDPARGPVFYTLADDAAGRPRVTPSETCLRCHHGANTAGVPGIYVGSVLPGPAGAPLRDESAIITDHTTSFDDRWGGWYVTAARTAQPGRSNAMASNPAEPDRLVRDVPAATPSLAALFDPRPYLAPTSDIVALMVFEHQTQFTNLVTRVAWQARLVAAGAARADAPDGLDDDIDDLADYALFVGEAPLTGPVEGVSPFARRFAAGGRRDAHGHSLRDLDLTTRLFRYPLSYLLGSAQVEALPADVRRRVLERIGRVLRGEVEDARYRHLTPTLRGEVLAVARATLPHLPPGF